MKKIVITLAFALSIMHVSAQTETNTSNNYNRWSVELGAGFNKPQRPFTLNNYYSSRISPLTTDLGVRYMLNNKFGLKVDFGYNDLNEQKNSSVQFDSKYYRVNLQAVANLGRIMDFESWTNRIGLLAHAGFGAGRIENKNFHVKEKVANVIAGFTGQVRITNRIALTADATTILNAYQDRTFDGRSATNSRGFSGLLFNGTLGLNAYLGKNEKHADWIVISENTNITDITALENRIANLEEQIKKIPEKQVIVEKPVTNTVVNNDKDVIKEMINDKYYCVYFDSNKSIPIENSTATIDVILSYLRKNPSASVDLVGYADQVGSTEYNNKLSYLRANNVKAILEKAGISPSRLNVINAATGTSIQKDTEEEKRLARRVAFRIK